MSGYCFDCRSVCDGGRCRSCGRFLCRKHVQAGFDQPVFCKSCFPAASSHQSMPDSPLLRFRDSRLSHLSEISSLSSPGSSRSDEEEIGDDGGKNIFGSDVDSVSTSISTEIQSLKSVHSSPLDSPSIGGETTRDNSPLDQEAPSYFRKAGAESEDLLDSLSVYRGQETQKVQQPLDFENNRLIWDPPLPEDENDDLESGFFGYDDEDEDGGGDSYNKFSFGSFSSHSFSTREKPSDEHKERLRNSVHGHFRALVCQLLRGEGLQVGSEDAGQGWLDIVSSLAWQAATFVKPDISKGGSMDPGNYVKVKCLLSGRPSDSTLVKGVVCTKNIKHKRMVSQHKNPRLFLLGGALEYGRVTNKLASINAVLEQEIDHLKKSISKIEAHRPNVLLVEKTVSSYAQQCLLAKEISLVLNVKRTLLERIARCTGAQIAPTIDNIGQARLGHCGMFRVERFFENCSSGSHPNKKAVKTLMFFEGCPRRLGCTVLLRGPYAEELKKVKHVVQYATFAACHLSRETSFLADEGATLPKVPINSSLAVSAEVLDADATILKTSTSPVLVAHKKLSSCSNDAITVFYQSSNVMSLHGDISTSNNNQLVGDVAVGSKEPCDQSDFATDARTSEEVMGHTSYEGKELKLHKEHGTASEGKKAGVSCENEPIDHSTADSHSILVSLSTTCVLKGTVCEPSQLLRIKFYSSFDKPLGRYICDDLFHQTSSCRSCNGPAEAHVRCYTHQHGSLTISVHRHPSVRLPGVRDGRIWMWHRCLKCEQDNGVPPAARRVVMSDAAWGLSFGKFLELSFSNHTAANRVASCGHSLQKDCLRFYGWRVTIWGRGPYRRTHLFDIRPCGRVTLAHALERVQKSGSMVAFFRYSPIDILSVHLPPLVLDFVCQSRQDRAEGEAACILSKLEFMHAEVNGVLQGIEQRTSEHEPLKGSIHKYIMDLKELLKRERKEYDVSVSRQQTLLQQYTDILQLNRLRRFLLIDSHMWDRRLCLLDSFYKSKTSTSKLQSSQKEWQVESIGEYGKFRILPEEVIPNISTLSNQKDLFLRASECGSNNLVDLDDETGTISETCIGNSSLERLPSAASALSDKIDSLWSGDPEADVIGSISLLDNPLCKKVIFPLRVNSFDSALRSRERLQGGLSSGSLHLNSVKSFNASGNFTCTNISEGYSRLKRLNFHPSHNPVFISSPYRIVGEGARLLLPQTGPDGIVIVLYDNEPTTIISYAISSQNHDDFVASDYQLSYGSIGNPSISQSQSEEATHFRISFDDMSSIPKDKVKFSVTCYFAKQFASLRKKCCPREADFLTSLSRCKRWNAQGGKSSVYFAKSFDERFILKQVTKTELDSFVVFAPEYFKYMAGSLNTGSPTCLAKVLGIYQVTVRHLNGGREVKMDLMVMENLFFGKTLSKVYDLKGSLRARYNPDTSGNDNVLLDMNLLESLRTKPIFLGSKAKRSLERAVWNDTSFLASVDVMDYSLLVGVDEGRKELVIGIIDYMRQYTWDKHLETWVKASGILGGSKNESPTVVSPLQYKKRFRKAMSKYFLTVPDQWSSHR